MNLKRRLLPANITNRFNEVLQSKESETSQNVFETQTEQTVDRQLPVSLEIKTEPKLNQELAEKQPVSDTSADISIVVRPEIPSEVIETQDITNSQSNPEPSTTVSDRISTSQSGSEGNRLDFYQIPAILSSMFAGASGSQILESLKAGLSKAKQQKDKFYESVFEGGIAANQHPINIEKAIACFHQAFDLSKQLRGRADGFLQNMVWNLFAKTGGNPAVAELLERAKTELKDVAETAKKKHEIVAQIFDQLCKLPGFESTFDCFKQKTEQAAQYLKSQAERKGRLAKDKTLLFFPGSNFIVQNKTNFLQNASAKPERSYLAVVNGFGTIIDPKPGFFDDCYRLGISLDEIRNIVFSSSRKLDPAWFEEALKTFSIRTAGQKVQIFVNPEITESFSDQFSRLEQSGCFDIVRLAERTSTDFGASETELPGGGFLSLRDHSVMLKFVSEQGRVQLVQFVDCLDDGISLSDELLEKVDVLVLVAENQNDLFHCLSAVKELIEKEKQPALLVFDVPKNKTELLGFADSLKQYLGNLPLAFASANLICNLEDRRFLDAVKAFESVNVADCWTDFLSLSSAVSELRQPFYFQDGKENDFEQGETDIVDSLRFAQRRRSGLYFE